MKARVKKTGEIVEVYHETQHGQVSNIYKESVFVNGRMFEESELDFVQVLADCTKEEVDAMSKTIQQLRKEKRQLLDEVCDWIKTNAYKYGKIKFEDNKAFFDFRTDSFINDLKQTQQ